MFSSFPLKIRAPLNRVNRSPARSQTKNRPSVDVKVDFALNPRGFHLEKTTFSTSVVIPMEKKCTKSTSGFFANFLSNSKLVVIISAE